MAKKKSAVFSTNSQSLYENSQGVWFKFAGGF